MGGCCGASTVAPEHDELTPRTLEKISEMFHRYDTDNDQYISFNELLAVMRSMGHNPMPAELEHMIREVDNSNTGMVNIDGFVDLMTREWEAGNPEVEVRETFAMLDTDGSGYITIASLLEFMNKHFENDGDKMEALLNDGDLDGDGKISSDEFVAAIMPNLPKSQDSKKPRRKSFIGDLPADHPALQANTPTNANEKVRLVDTLVK